MIIYLTIVICLVCLALFISVSNPEGDKDEALDETLETLERIGRSLEALQEKNRETVNNAYSERNKCVAALARLAVKSGWRAGLGVDQETSPGWKNVVYIDLPTGQVSWHIPDSEAKLFDFLEEYPKNGMDMESKKNTEDSRN